MNRAAVIVILAASLTSTANAREPTKANRACCERYATYAQDDLDAYRSADGAKIQRLQNAISHDRDQTLILALGAFGWDLTTPPWVTDVSETARDTCLNRIRGDMMGYVSGDPERQKAGNTPDNHVGSITVMPPQATMHQPPPAHASNHLIGIFHGFNDIHFLDVPCTEAAASLTAQNDSDRAVLAWMASQPGKLMIYYSDGKPGEVACYIKTAHGISMHSKGFEQAFLIDDTRIRWIRKPISDSN